MYLAETAGEEAVFLRTEKMSVLCLNMKSRTKWDKEFVFSEADFLSYISMERRKKEMVQESTVKKAAYEKAVAEVVHFDNSDVITTSGGDGGSGCVTWSNQNGVACHYGLTAS